MMAASKRFVLFEKSELIMPNFARIARMPNLAVSMSSGYPYAETRSSGRRSGPARHGDDRRRRDLPGPTAAFVQRRSSRQRHLRRRDPRRARVFCSAGLDGARSCRSFEPVRRRLRRASKRLGHAGAIETPTRTAAMARHGVLRSATPEFTTNGRGLFRSRRADFGARDSPRAIYDRIYQRTSRRLRLAARHHRQDRAPERRAYCWSPGARAGAALASGHLVAAPNAGDWPARHARPRCALRWSPVEGRAAAFAPRGGVVPDRRGSDA